MTLAFISGLFRCLGEVISQISITGPADVASELAPESESRAEFLRRTIRYANDFLATNSKQFGDWERQVQVQKVQTVLTNGVLARSLACLVSDEFGNFFNVLEKSKSFERGEVKITIYKDKNDCRSQNISESALIQKWDELSWY